MAAMMASPDVFEDNNWYPESGATNHVNNDLSNLNLSSNEYLDSNKLLIGNGSGLQISRIGSSSFSNSGNFKSFVLRKCASHSKKSH